MNQLLIDQKDLNTRIDVFLTKTLREDEALAEYLGILSRSFVQKQLLGLVRANDESIKASYKLRIDDVVEYDIQEIIRTLEKWKVEKQEIENIPPENGNLDIVHEDDEVIVINKPKGLVVHPGNGNESGTLANMIKGYLMEKGAYDPFVDRVGIVHRLDKPVSGLMVIAKTKRSQMSLKEQFESHQVLKVYEAISSTLVEKFTMQNDVEPLLIKNEWLKGSLDLAKWERVAGFVGRDEKSRMKMSFKQVKISDSYRKAVSYFARTEERKYLVMIETGRMHQIRATMASIGISIEGDTLYGPGRTIPEEIALSSILLGFKKLDQTKVVYAL